MVEEVLPLVPYRQLVFTIPRNLRRAFLLDRTLYGELCRVSYASTRDFLRKRASATIPKSQKAVPAMVVSPQSFGDLLVAHAHAHAICSLGLFTRDGVFHPMEDLDLSGLEEIFRERFFGMMLRRGKITPETVEIMKGWTHSGFSIGWERKIETWDRKGLEGLLSYMERAPVSLRRLTYRPDGMVHYQGTKLHPRLGRDHQLLPALDFLALLVPHIMLRYEVTLRCYGAISTTFRRKLGWIQEPPTKEPPPQSRPFSRMAHADPSLLETIPPPTPAPTPLTPRAPEASSSLQGEESEFARKRRRSWARLIAKTWLCDPELCPACGKRMRLVAAITHPDQDGVIEKILRHLHLWDPPWKKERQARGPPASPPSPGSSWRDSSSSREAWSECIDPPHPEDHLDPPSQEA